MADVKKDVPKGPNNTAALMKAFNKDYGAKTAMAPSEIQNVDRIPTGLFQVDLCTGGGFPRGRSSIVVGPESSGKSNLIYCAIRENQKLHPEDSNVIVDAEDTFDPSWAEYLGVDMNKLSIIKPDYAEQAVDIVEALLMAEDAGIVMLDSVNALMPTNEVDNGAERVQVGGNAQVVTKMVNKITLALSRQKRAGRYPTFISVSQLRMNIGQTQGNPEKIAGGWSYKHASSLTLRVYGKDEIEKAINPNLAAYKATSVIVKKRKVPVVGLNCEYKLALINQKKLKAGHCKDWNTVATYLKKYACLGQTTKAGWSLVDPTTGETWDFKLQDEVEGFLEQNAAVSHRVKQYIMDTEIKASRYPPEAD